MYNMRQDIEEILYTEEQIAEMIARLGAEITRDYQGKELVVVGVLKGAIMTTADVLRQIDLPCTIDFVAASSYGAKSETSGEVQICKDITTDLTGKHVLLVEDILDTGVTLTRLCRLLADRGCASVKLCVLFDKPERRVVPITADYVGGVVPNKFIVGYGLDYNEKYRNLPYIAVLKPEIYTQG